MKCTNIGFFPSALHSHPALSRSVWMLLCLFCDSIHILNHIDIWLILAKSEQMVVLHRYVVLAHKKYLGLRLNARKVCFLQYREPLIWAWCGIQPRCRHVCPLLGSSRSHGSQESERRPVTHCQAVSETAGSDSSCIQSDIYIYIWPAVHETHTVVAQEQEVLLEGKPTPHTRLHGDAYVP